MLPATVLSREYAPVGSLIPAVLFLSMYTLLRSLRGLNQTGQNKYMENREKALHSSQPLCPASAPAPWSIRTEARSIQWKRNKSSQVELRVLKKRSPQYIVKQYSPSLVSGHHLVSVLQPCPCSCSTVMRDIGLVAMDSGLFECHNRAVICRVR